MQAAAILSSKPLPVAADICLRRGHKIARAAGFPADTGQARRMPTVLGFVSELSRLQLPRSGLSVSVALAQSPPDRDFISIRAGRNGRSINCGPSRTRSAGQEA